MCYTLHVCFVCVSGACRSECACVYVCVYMIMLDVGPEEDAEYLLSPSTLFLETRSLTDLKS